MTKKKKEVPLPGYIKPSFIPDESLSKKELAIIPPYPDAGVDYAGYSKTQKGPAEFVLNPQTLYNDTVIQTALTGSSTSYMANPPEGKQLYIKSVQINCSVAAVDVNTYVQLIDSFNLTNQKILWQTQLLRSESVEVTFGVPLKVANSRFGGVRGFMIKINAAATTINAISVNVQGWIE